MALADRTKDIVIPYTIDGTFEALKKAVFGLKGFKINGFDEKEKTVYLSTGISVISWGEIMTVSLAQAQTGGTVVSILSAPKTGVFLGGLIDLGKNRENIAIIIEALSAELKGYPQLNPD